MFPWVAYAWMAMATLEVAEAREIGRMVSGIAFHRGDLPVGALAGAGRWEAWDLGNPPVFRKGDVAWLRFRPSESLADWAHVEDRALALNTANFAFETYLGGRKVESFGEIRPGSRPVVPGWLGVMRLFRAPRAVSPDGEIFVRLQVNNREAKLFDTPRAGNHGAIVRQTVASEVERLALGVLALAAGVFQLALVMFHRSARAFLASGCLALCIGGHVLVTTATVALMEVAPRLMLAVDHFALYGIPTFFSLVFLSFFDPKPKRLFEGMALLFFALWIVVPTLTLAGIIPNYSLLPSFQALLVVAMVVVILCNVRLVLRKNVDGALFLAGFCVLFVFGLVEILEGRFLPERSPTPWTYYGFLAQALMPAIILIRRFVAAQRTLRATVDERNLALERLDRVLSGTRRLSLQREGIAACIVFCRSLLEETGAHELRVKIWMAAGEGQGRDLDVALSRESEKVEVVGTSPEPVALSFTPAVDGGRLFIPVHFEGRLLALIEVEAFSGERAALVELVGLGAASLGVVLERSRLGEMERRHLVEIVKLAADVSDKLNSPLMALVNAIQALRGAAPERQERLLGLMGRSLAQLQLVSRDLSQLRELAESETTELLSVDSARQRRFGK